MPAGALLAGALAAALGMRPALWILSAGLALAGTVFVASPFNVTLFPGPPTATVLVQESATPAPLTPTIALTTATVVARGHTTLPATATRVVPAISLTAVSHATARKLVTLSPGAVANAVLQIAHAVNFPAAKCGLVTAGYLQIYPPNQTTPAYLHYSSQACAKPVRILTVSVVQAGSGGQ